MKVCFVCLGNICRSPMAEFVMKEVAKDKDWSIESRATSSWEHGNPIHPGTQGILRDYAVAYDKKKSSQQISKRDLEQFDAIIGMDQQNVRDLLQLSAGVFDQKIHLFVEGGVPDPYYTGDFEETYALVTKGCQAWLKRLEKEEK